MEPETILLVYEFLFWLAVALLILFGSFYLLGLTIKFVNSYIDKQLDRCNKILSKSKRLDNSEVSAVKAIVKYYESLKIKRQK